MSEYYQLHKEERIAYERTYYRSHKDQLKAKRKIYLQTLRPKYSPVDGKRRREREKLRRQNDPEYREYFRAKRREYSRRYMQKLFEARNLIFAEHGNKCDRCGFNDVRALTTHHVFGNHVRNRPARNLKEIVERKVPIAVLCMNCQMIIHYHGKALVPYMK